MILDHRCSDDHHCLAGEAQTREPKPAALTLVPSRENVEDGQHEAGESEQLEHDEEVEAIEAPKEAASVD